jgi:hypothetical protein
LENKWQKLLISPFKWNVNNITNIKHQKGSSQQSGSPVNLSRIPIHQIPANVMNDKAKYFMCSARVKNAHETYFMTRQNILCVVRRGILHADRNKGKNKE